MSGDLFPENTRAVTLTFNGNRKCAVIGGVYDLAGNLISVYDDAGQPATGAQWQRSGRTISATYTRAQLQLVTALMREPTLDEMREWRARRLAIHTKTGVEGGR